MERLQWRRNKVLELSSQGGSQPEIATILQVGLGTISRDIQYLTTNGIVITDAIKFVQTNKEKLTTTMSTKENDNDNKESEEPDYDDDKEEQEEETGGLGENQTTNQVF